MTKQSTRRKSTESPKAGKPYPGFPLFPHASGRWAKKVRGQFKYFGKVTDDPKGKRAESLWNEQRDDLMAGRSPAQRAEGMTVRDVVNAYLTHSSQMLESGELAERTFRDRKKACERVVEAFGRLRLITSLTAADFGELRAAMAKHLGPVALGVEIQRVRSIFVFGVKSNKITVQIPWTLFKKPAARVVRAAKRRKGVKDFSREELLQIIGAAGIPLKAMVLLAANCGIGNRDLAMLPVDAVDLDRGWLDYPRQKTEVERRAALWPETVDALRAVIAKRKEPNDPENAKLLFITRQGECFVKHSLAEKGAWTDSIGLLFGRLLRKLDLKTTGRGFYRLRHTFRSIAAGAKDEPAANYAMGHAPEIDDMAATYSDRPSISDERLREVADYVHEWLWPKPVKPPKSPRKPVAAR